MFVIGLLAGFVISLVLLFFALRRVMFLENESNYGFEETNAAIEKQAAEMKWGIPSQYDLQATLKKNGFEVLPVRVFSLCKPSVAHKILGTNRERIASALMPCRVSVYERNDGKVYVSRLNAALFSRFLGKQIREAMKEAAVENERILEPLIRN